MKTNFGIHIVIIQILLFLILATTTEALFFAHPKKLLLEFFKSLKEKKTDENTTTDYHHVYHHYYPMPINIISEHPVKAPDTYELNYLHNKKLKSMGWNDYEYKHVPEPEIIVPSSFHDSSSLGYPEEHPWNENEEFYSNSHQYKLPEESVDFPMHQEIIVHEVASDSKEKNHMLSTFLKKIQTVKNILHKDHDYIKCHDKVTEPTHGSDSNVVNTYVVYLHPKGSEYL